jgi:hypothetical protein
MPMLIYSIPEYLHELLQNCCLASVALLRKLRAVMVMAVDTAFVLVVGVLGAKHGWTDRASEMLDVVFPV